MTFSDYLLDSILVGLVLLQIRGRRLTPRVQLMPLVIVGYFAVHYLHSFPTAGNDLWLEIGLLLVGLALGVGAGVYTKVYRREDSALMAKATPIAAALWVVGMGSRFAFSVWANSHSGGISLYNFTMHHSLTISVWTDAVLFMALAEVLSRSAIIAVKAQRIRNGSYDPISSSTTGSDSSTPVIFTTT